MIIQDPRDKATQKILGILYEIEALKHLSPQRAKVFRTYSGKLVGHNHIQRDEFDAILAKLHSDGIAEFDERNVGLSWGENSMTITVLSWKKFDAYKKRPESPQTSKKTATTKQAPLENSDTKLSGLHPEVIKHCSSLYKSAHYAEAAEKSFKVVRARLRKLTGHETGSEAFGKGNLYIKGSAEPSTPVVDKDFQEAVKFLTMSIDNFRNEKVHVVDGNINSPERAYEYLVLSSLAMRHLDNAEIKS
jgi:uncharacterized protein (TIGR02391 family)